MKYTAFAKRTGKIEKLSLGPDTVAEIRFNPAREPQTEKPAERVRSAAA